ncbi:hypothetical protein D3C79_1070800 [compost metagenome]
MDGESLADLAGQHRLGHLQRQHAGIFPLPDPPDVQVTDLGAGQLGDHLADLLHHGGIHLRIQQHQPGVA